jgi:hypothetical protein
MEILEVNAAPNDTPPRAYPTTDSVKKDIIAPKGFHDRPTHLY